MEILIDFGGLELGKFCEVDRRLVGSAFSVNLLASWLSWHPRHSAPMIVCYISNFCAGSPAHFHTFPIPAVFPKFNYLPSSSPSSTSTCLPNPSPSTSHPSSIHLSQTLTPIYPSYSSIFNPLLTSSHLCPNEYSFSKPIILHLDYYTKSYSSLYKDVYLYFIPFVAQTKDERRLPYLTLIPTKPTH